MTISRFALASLLFISLTSISGCLVVPDRGHDRGRQRVDDDRYRREHRNDDRDRRCDRDDDQRSRDCRRYP